MIFNLDVPQHNAVEHTPAEGELEFLNKLKARTAVLSWDHVSRYTADKTIFPQELFSEGISLSLMTELVEVTSLELKSNEASETFVSIISAGSVHHEGDKSYPLLYYTGSFDDFHGFNGVSYQPIPKAILGHRVKKLLTTAWSTITCTTKNMLEKLEEDRKTPAREECIAAFNGLLTVALGLHKKLGKCAELSSCIKKLAADPSLQMNSEHFNAHSARYMFAAQNCVVYVGCDPPLAIPGHPSDLIIGGEKTKFIPDATMDASVDDLLDGLSEYDDKVRAYLECQLSECLLTVDLTKKTTILISNGNSGKTRLLNLLRDMSGPLGRILSETREFFLGCRKRHISDLKLMRHKTGLLCEELGSEKQPINSDIYKLVSGGFSKPVENKSYFDSINASPKIVITCNNPKFTQFGDAEQRRTVFFNCKYVFVRDPDPDIPHEKQIDDTLGTKLQTPKALEYMLCILAKAAARAVCKPVCRVMPVEVRRSSDIVANRLVRDRKLPEIKIKCDWQSYMKEVNEENKPISDCPKLSFEDIRRQALECWQDNLFDMVKMKVDEWLAHRSRSDRSSLSKYLAKDSERRERKRGGKLTFRFPERKRRWILDHEDEQAPKMELVVAGGKKARRQVPEEDDSMES